MAVFRDWVVEISVQYIALFRPHSCTLKANCHIVLDTVNMIRRQFYVEKTNKQYHVNARANESN